MIEAEYTEHPRPHAWSADDTHVIVPWSAVHHSSSLSMATNPADDTVVAGGGASTWQLLAPGPMPFQTLCERTSSASGSLGSDNGVDVRVS